MIISSNYIYDICISYYNEGETDLNISETTLVKYTCDRLAPQSNWLLSTFSETDDSNQKSGLI